MRTIQGAAVHLRRLATGLRVAGRRADGVAIWIAGDTGKRQAFLTETSERLRTTAQGIDALADELPTPSDES